VNEVPPSSSPPLDVRHPALRATLQAMAGVTESTASARTHLKRFWSGRGIDLLEAPLSPAEQSLHGALERWFASRAERALLEGADARARTKVAARLAVEVAHRRQAKVVFVPVSRALGTAVERDMLELFFALFDTSQSAVFSRPRTVRELVASISLGLQGVGWVSSLPDEDDPRLLVVVDGLEAAADGWPRTQTPFLAEIGEGVSALVTAAPRPPTGATGWLDRLGWPAEATTQLTTPGETEGGDGGASRVEASPVDRGSAVAAPAAARVRAALGAALAPMSEHDLRQAMGLGGEDLAALLEEPSETAPWIRIDADGGPLWCADGAAATEADAAHTRFEQAVVARGSDLLDAPAAEPWCAYGIEYLGAHMVRRACSAEELLRLVSPRWLAQWSSRPRALLGFLCDAARARDACTTRLIDACRDTQPGAADGRGGVSSSAGGAETGDGVGGASPARVARPARDERERAEMLRGIVRCALVEHALLSKEGSREADHDRQAPYTPAPLELARPTGCARQRAEALATFAALLPGADGDAVRELARQASAGMADVAAQTVVAVTTDPRETDLERGAKLRAGATHDELDGWLSRDLRIRPTGLAPDEAWALADTRSGEARMVAFAGILADLPESRRAAAVREVMAGYSATAGHEALRIAVACAPWMARVDAARVLATEIGGSWSEPRSMFVGYGGLAELTPLLQRVGGDAAVVGAAAEIVAVGSWLP
jgi:hypothetical protein